ncbi:MAG TPA: fumarylacetoacetate hydrolase family protein [Chloroflexota bacterium]|nr:fumarylacetoacetate hydrolase family protein [Chloroflexota bacterium]
MKIVVFGPQERTGALVGDNIVDLNAANSSIPASLLALIEAGQPALELAGKVIEQHGSSAPDGKIVFKASEVKLHAPWPGKRIACAGGNFGKHLMGMESGGNVTLEEVVQKARDRGQWGFWKVPAEVAGPGDEVPFPNRTKYFDYEGEAAIVIGKRGKDIPASAIDDYVWGITLLNDWSIRDGGGRPFPMSYNLAKNFDRSTSMGPCIVVGELAHGNVPVQLKVNGELRQDYSTSEMVFSFGEILAELSRDFTFVPGDVISGGTQCGTAADKTPKGPDGTKATDLFLKPGDVVELSSPKIGSLTNRIV